MINDNGLTKVAANFSGTITGVSAVGGNTWVGAESPGVNKTLSTVGTFGVTETAAAGYTTTYSGCSGTIALGETKTCTVTNNDNPASPPGTTSQKVLLHDSISIPGIRSGAGNQAAATATFRLYTDNLCTVPVLVCGNPYAEAVVLSYSAPVSGVTTGSAATSRRRDGAPAEDRVNVLLDGAVRRRREQHRFHDEVRRRDDHARHSVESVT